MAASVSNAEIHNNTRGSVAARLAAQSESAAAANVSRAATVPVRGFTPSFGFSSPFLAQLLSQDTASADNVEAFVTLATGPVIDLETLQAFSQVKYRPSNAFQPPPSPARVQVSTPAPVKAAPVQLAPQPAVDGGAQGAAQRSQQVAVNNSPVGTSGGGQQLSLFTAAPAAATGALSAPVRTDPPALRTDRGSLPKPTGKSAASLISPRGFDAYIATFSRNFANLGAHAAPVAVNL